jgi:hypothetical protein
MHCGRGSEGGLSRDGRRRRPARPTSRQASTMDDALLLSRIQFGFTIAFHIVFPSITIGLASYLALLEALWLRT